MFCGNAIGFCSRDWDDRSMENFQSELNMQKESLYLKHLRAVHVTFHTWTARELIDLGPPESMGSADLTLSAPSLQPYSKASEGAQPKRNLCISEGQLQCVRI